MTSNAYIATDGETVMKVGKANILKRREKQIAIPMTFTIACLDEAAAFRVESGLRQFVIGQGGIRHQGTIDWFRFDQRIYEMLCEFAKNFEAIAFPKPEPIELDLETEIRILVARYHKLLEEELEAKYRIALDEADRQIEQLKVEGNEHLEEIRRLDRENAVLRYRLEKLEEDDDE